MNSKSPSAPNLAPLGGLSHMSEALEQIPVLCSGKLSTAFALNTFFQLLYWNDLDQHAQYRLEFWQSFLQAGLIHQAWLILAPEAERMAKQEWDLKKHQLGMLEKCRRVDEHHAVLLMRIGDLVVAEWSHAGKCRFWKQTNPLAPRLFKGLYKRDELINGADHIQQHYFSSKGYWQKDAIQWMESAEQKTPVSYQHL